MTCYRIRDNWHSYVKGSLDKAELDEMASHLEVCSECRSTVSAIEKTLLYMSEKKALPNPPEDLKINVMKAINKTLYRKNTIDYFRILQLKQWGFSLVATGILLFTLNLSALNPGADVEKLFELPFLVSEQITASFSEMGRFADSLDKFRFSIGDLKDKLIK